MRRLVVHVGLPKTGTTSIQTALLANRGELLKQGVLYPKSGTITSGGHLHLAWQSLDDWKFNPARGGWADVASEVHASKADCVFLSAETFGGYSTRDEIIRDITAFASEIDAEIRIVGCARPQASHMESVYAQSASTGFEQRKFDTFVTHSLIDKRFELEHVFGRWFEAYSDVRLFEYAPGADGGVLPMLMKSAGLKGLRLPSTEPLLNQRVGTRCVEYVRSAAEVLRPLEEIDRRAKHKIARMLRELCMAQIPDDPDFVGFDEAMRRKIEAHFAELNERFDQDRLGSVGIFTDPTPHKARKRNVVDLDRATPRERKLFASLFASAISKALNPG